MKHKRSSSLPHVLLSAIFISGLANCNSTSTATKNPNPQLSDADLKKSLEIAAPARALVDDKFAPGVAVALVELGKEPVFLNFGLGNVERKESVTEQTVFHIVSITKVFSALVLADLVVQKRVTLDTPLLNLLPSNISFPPPYKASDVTLELLATHRSGLTNLSRVKNLGTRIWATECLRVD